MRSPAEISTAGAVGEPGAIARTIVYSVLISAGVLLLNIGWGRPEVAITLLLALLLSYACGVALMRLLAVEKQRTLAALWRSLVLSAAGLLLLGLFGRNDWLMMLPGIVIGGIGLGGTPGDDSVVAAAEQHQPGNQSCLVGSHRSHSVGDIADPISGIDRPCQRVVDRSGFIGRVGGAHCRA